jgi:3-deoxy-D-manno-octulosonate 8-phosphate phosphatase (KDO 8-P phosphatase)
MTHALGTDDRGEVHAMPEPPSSSPVPGPEASWLAERCGRIELLVLDVDGVLTDGVIALDDRGVETKNFHVRDGSAIALWRRAGKRAAILSGRRARAVELRAEELAIEPVMQGVSEKAGAFQAIVAGFGLKPEQACYVGDDIADLSPLALAGLAACPMDAAAEVRRAVHYVAEAGGGRGAVREIVELLLKSQGLWDRLARA